MKQFLVLLFLSVSTTTTPLTVDLSKQEVSSMMILFVRLK